MATNAGGSTHSKLIRFRTSPVTITSITTRGGDLLLVLRCHGSAPCRFRLQGRSGTRVMLSSQGYDPREPQRDRHAHADTRVRDARDSQPDRDALVLSTWNGVTATVSATI